MTNNAASRRYYIILGLTACAAIAFVVSAAGPFLFGQPTTTTDTGPAIARANHVLGQVEGTTTGANTLTINRSGVGGGSVSVAANGKASMSCPNSSTPVSASPCSLVYPMSSTTTLLTLTATPDTASTFAGWDGCPSGSTATSCSVSLTANTSINAKFNLKSGQSAIAVVFRNDQSQTSATNVLTQHGLTAVSVAANATIALGPYHVTYDGIQDPNFVFAQAQLVPNNYFASCNVHYDTAKDKKGDNLIYINGTCAMVPGIASKAAYTYLKSIPGSQSQKNGTSVSAIVRVATSSLTTWVAQLRKYQETKLVTPLK